MGAEDFRTQKIDGQRPEGFDPRVEAWIDARAARMLGATIMADRVQFTSRMLEELALDLRAVRAKLIALAALCSFRAFIGITSDARAVRLAKIGPRRFEQMQERWRVVLELPGDFAVWAMALELPPLPAEEAESVDSPAEELAEAADVVIEVARMMMPKLEARVQERLQRYLWQSRTAVLQAIVVELLATSGNEQVQFCALMLAAGMAEVIDVKSQVEAAERCCVTRADMSYFVTQWKDRLRLRDTTFSRDEETSERCRQARLRVVNAGGRHE